LEFVDRQVLLSRFLGAYMDYPLIDSIKVASEPLLGLLGHLWSQLSLHDFDKLNPSWQTENRQC
jgi:hypothetical protein